jgi:DNA polymerase I-like protein with 3'-5' exonuclease and polymerase domains
MGAITTRCTHSHPNLAQIPSNSAPYGKECRGLFGVEQGEYLVGCDVSGLELRMLAHYMAMYDGGAYGEIILNGDIHTENQKAAGLPTRNNAKTFIYGFLYGAGDAKIAEIVGGTARQGKALKEKFLSNTPALKQLREAVANKVKSTSTLKSLDGRILPVRHQHAALNTLLQSAGAIVCKMWVVHFHKLMREAGYVHGVHYKQAAFVHDELQVRVNAKVFPIQDGKSFVGDTAKRAIKEVGEMLKVRLPLDGEYAIGKSYAETH